MLLAIVLIPFIAGLLAFIIRRDVWRRAVLVAGAACHLALVLFAWAARPEPIFNGWLGLDAAGLLFLSIASVLFMASALYGIGYLAREKHEERVRPSYETKEFFSNAPEAVLTGCLLFFLGTMSLVCISRHLGLFWVAIEATTLASAPLIYFHRHHRSLAAAWKYLLICSIGIALALMGIFLLAVSAMDIGQESRPLLLENFIAHAAGLNPLWLKAAFIFLLVGYGTKMGLAPLHTWLPDAHSESPSIVSALLSGALLNCAFLGILRAHQICVAAGLALFSQDLLVLFGLFSMGLAAVMILRQSDFKRMLAYSSVEHMGILALGIGIGGVGTFGAMFHAVNHSLTKAMLFLVAGNILSAYQTKSTSDVRGLARLMPASALLWLAGFFAITGSPPFGAFLSEFTILKSALDQGRNWTAVVYLLFLSLIFIAMTTIVLRMAHGKTEEHSVKPVFKENWLTIAPPATLGLLTLLLGLYLPSFLGDTLHEAAQLFGGR